MGFLARYNYFVNELGIAIIEPNVRGSSGFGKTFLTLDNGTKRETRCATSARCSTGSPVTAVRCSRVLVSGGSYGGYMSLAVATHYADRIAGAIDIVGISNFVTFLQNTESYRRDLRRVEYGDERDPAMREFLLRISPLTNAHRHHQAAVRRAGQERPRASRHRAEQIVSQGRSRTTPRVVPARRERTPRLRAQGEADYEFYRDDPLMRRR
jgi:pimeloyl-ACP methyl ester carboxylesterase